METIVLNIYVVGMIVAFIIGCIQAFNANRRGEDISDFPACISIIPFMSWMYVIIDIYKYFYEKNENKK